MSTIKPFTIDVPQSKLDDLRERIGRTIWPSTIKGQSYGGPELAQIKELTQRAVTFDWRKKEAELNELPNFITTIDGQDIHFIHVKSKEPGAIPLLLIHGWPGSVVEFLDHIGPLTAPAKHGAAGAQAFDVVIPSLPGVGVFGSHQRRGLEQPAHRQGVHRADGAPRLRKFALQGGDAGAIIGPEIGRMAPEKIIGIHLNAATIGFMPMGPVSDADAATFTPAEKARLAMMQEFMQVKFGFNLLQSNQPQLVAYAISDSPVGLMAWMTQLMDPAEVGERFLTNFMIYWLTDTAASSIRLYYENAHDPARLGAQGQLRRADRGRRLPGRRHRHPPVRGSQQHHRPLDRVPARRSLRRDDRATRLDQGCSRILPRAPRSPR